jgi:hypothetical protein
MPLTLRAPEAIWCVQSWSQDLSELSSFSCEEIHHSPQSFTPIIEASCLGADGRYLMDTLGLLMKFVWGVPSQCGVPSDCFSLFCGEIMTNTGHYFGFYITVDGF